MKRITAIALLAAAGTLGLGNAFAQDYAVRATMPFDFTVGNKSLPTGTYTILQVGDDLLEIRNQDGKVAIMSTAYRDGDQSISRAVLVFNRYGNQYFLRQIAGGPSSINEELPVSKSENTARHQQNLALDQSQVAIPLDEAN